MTTKERFKIATRAMLSDVFDSDNIDEGLAFSLDIIMGALEGQAGAFWMLNTKRDRIFPVSSKCPADITNISMRIGTGIAGAVVSSQESVLYPGSSSGIVTPLSEDYLGLTASSVICVPIVNNKDVIGCLEIVNKKDGSPFTAEDVEMCEHLANLSTITMDDKGFFDIVEEPKDILISITDLKKDYENGESKLHVLKGLNLNIYKSEFLVILGESGCGKSTLMNIIGGMDTLTSGHVAIEGRDISHLSERDLTLYRRDYLGFVFQSYNLMPNLTALENVRYIAELVDDPMKPEDAIAKVNLTAKSGFYPGQMSGGQQQRVSIARAIVKNPKLILADEPTAALDYQTSIEVLSVIEDVVKTKGTTIVMITHNPQIAKMADRVITLRNGVVANIKRNLQPVSATELVW
ncbi:MAG: ATP-binding cassette domain-containing protein [Clostridiales bacterium]|nr:ATP-binding cassette domain-containing protein [Clostridiales bacterium]